MKKRTMLIAAALLAALAALSTVAYIRLAPTPASRWHVDPGSLPISDCTAQTPTFTTTRSSARIACLMPDDPATLLARLDAIALATPRTRRIAGDPASGRITWESRSAIWAFPDFTTAQATQTPAGTRLDLLARSRFGDYDWGVNAGRLTGWLKAL